MQQSKSKTKKKGKSHKILKFLSKTCFSLGTLDDALEVYGNVAVAWSRLSIKPRFDVNVVHMLSAHRQEAIEAQNQEKGERSPVVVRNMSVIAAFAGIKKSADCC